MIEYRSVRDGRIVERPEPDEWLDASAGWERVVEEDAPKGKRSSSATERNDD